ncbi:NADH-quinone oxidoreductase subunit C [Paenibacillus tianmuensis]|uniref:NADH-quinone oxidoreductase subunit C n=1 Tax=Paenibacillus tianmuensis TaxID=624147 RepID=A0A1G4RPX7_9BACL|nr:NADH-quinone oxidoreductase subunit C [Paenibacillus tianmuensis]SCW58229.1 NADH-quinone oxidoreductase subunit C [Paenibacillus tianmuensis]
MSEEQKREKADAAAAEEQKQAKADASTKPSGDQAESASSEQPANDRVKAGTAGEQASDTAKASVSQAPVREAVAEARAARANARAAKAEGAEPEAPKEPSQNQPLLDRLVAILKDFRADAVEEAFINEKDGHIPYVIVKAEAWPGVAELLRTHEELKLNYLRNVSGVDMETHMEVAYHIISLETKRNYCVKVKTDRESPSIPSVTPVWPTADWNEREVYDLFGIDFPGHPDLRRIMMADDWVGHPLRKDYEPLDPEV